MTLLQSSLSEGDNNPAVIQIFTKAEQALHTPIRLYYGTYTTALKAQMVTSHPYTRSWASKGLHVQSSSCSIAQMLYHILVNQMRPQERQLLQSVVGSDDGNVDMLEQDMHATQARWISAMGSNVGLLLIDASWDHKNIAQADEE